MWPSEVNQIMNRLHHFVPYIFTTIVKFGLKQEYYYLCYWPDILLLLL